MIEKAHIGHPGVDGTRLNLRDTHFPGKEKKIRKFIHDCLTCRSKRPPKKVELKGIRPDKVGEVYCVDSCQFENREGFVFVAMDLLSSSTVIHVADTKEARNAKRSLQRLMTVCGVPRTILSDNGRECMGEFNEYCKEIGAKRITTSIEHPNSNPAERRIGRIKELNKCLKIENDQSSLEELELILNHQRSVVSGFSPKEIVTGISKGTIMTNFNDCLMDVNNRKEISSNINAIRDRKLEKLNRKRSSRIFEPGELVLVYQKTGQVELGVVKSINFHNGYDVEVAGNIRRISGDQMIKFNAFHQGEDVI